MHINGLHYPTRRSLIKISCAPSATDLVGVRDFVGVIFVGVPK